MDSEVEKILMLDACREDCKNFNSENEILSDEALRAQLAKEVEDSYQIYVNYFNNNSTDQLKKSQKDPVLSNLLRHEGNNLLIDTSHNSEVHEKIWKLYTKGIALAPSNSEELARGYGNRSYILLHFNKFEDAIKDIDRAIAITKSDALKIKLLSRKIICLTELNDGEQKKKTFKLVKSIFDNMDKISKTEKLYKLLKEAEEEVSVTNFNQPLEKKKRILPFSTKSVNVRYNDECGIHLVAAHDLQPGDMAMVLKPFVTAANSNKFYSYCSHCLAFVWSSIPCDHCCLSMFCSEQCKIEAWENYHKIECKILPHIQFDLALYYYYQMSMRVIFMSVKESGSISQFLEKIKDIDQFTDKYKKDFNEEGFSNNDFISFYTLPHKHGLRYFPQFFKNSVLLLALIIQATDFFGKDVESKNGLELAQDENVMFINLLLLKFSLISYSNLEHISVGECKKKRSMLECTGRRCCPRGAYVTPAIGMVGSDCNASFSKCITDDGKVIYFCTQPIEKDSQIFVNSFNYFFREGKESRKMSMKLKSYTCKCQACEENWPTLDALLNSYMMGMSDKKNMQSTIGPEIIAKYDKLTVNKIDDYIPDEETFQQICEDLTKVVNTCGQPTFLTSLLTDVLCNAFHSIYAYGLSHCLIPKTCSNF